MLDPKIIQIRRGWILVLLHQGIMPASRLFRYRLIVSRLGRIVHGVRKERKLVRRSTGGALQPIHNGRPRMPQEATVGVVVVSRVMLLNLTTLLVG